MASKSKAKAKSSAKAKPAKAAAKPKPAAQPKRAPAKPPKGSKPSAKSVFGSIKGAPEASPLPFHPLANIFPLIEGREFEDLTASIKANGLRDAIIVHEGQVLDGRNRQNACIAAGVACRYEMFPSDQDALKFVIDKNLRRRQLNDAQRASVAAKIANLGHGGDRSKLPNGRLNDDQAAEALNVATRQVRRARVVHEQGGEQVRAALDRGDIPVATAEKISRLPKEEQAAAVEAAKPNGARSIMSSRQEPDDSLDFFPTPPWATRALMERVFPQLGFIGGGGSWRAWEPACGEGHIAEVLGEYFGRVHATDIADYGYAIHGVDFLDVPDSGWDWIITNPPFGEKTEQFVLHALEHAQVGVAMFMRVQWLDSIGRYERVFRDKPPTLIAFFAERVNLCKGRWEPDGATATAYIWLVWLKGEEPRAPFWIPPGCREGLTHADDAVRFTMHPVGGATEAATNIPENIPDADHPWEAGELWALERIEAGDDIDQYTAGAAVAIFDQIKKDKLARGSVKLKLTKAGMKRLELLRLEAYAAADQSEVSRELVFDRDALNAAIDESAELLKVDCRVCSDGNGLCVECIAAADHTVVTTEELDDLTNTWARTCWWRSDADEYDQLAAALKSNWQNVVAEAKAASSSIAEAAE